MNKIQCEILGLSSNPSSSGAFAILLKEIGGSRRLPIIIGGVEAQAIAFEMEGIKPPRPLTHDLLKSLIESLGVIVSEVLISELKENTFYAKIILESSGLTTEIDSRPSDAIALAVRTYAPIFVLESVLDIAAYAPSEDSEFSEFENKGIGNEKKQLTKEAQLAVLQEKLRESLEKEDFERAAKLRDEIKKLTQNN